MLPLMGSFDKQWEAFNECLEKMGRKIAEAQKEHEQLAGNLYRPLRDLALFSQVQIDPEAHTLVWPNGADFDPATLHDWPTHAEALATRARQWDLMPT
jgi:hypothetical protein